MKKFFGLAAVLVAFGLALAFAGCSNSSDDTAALLLLAGTKQAAVGGITPGSAYEETLTINLSDSEKLSAAGAASLAAGTDVSAWFSDKTVSASVGSDGFIGFKAVIVSATETSLVIKVTGVAGIKKCSVTLSITIPATVTASGKEVKKENVKTVGIGVEPQNPADGAEVLQTEHVTVEKIKGGLKFKIKRPSESCYDPNAVLSETVFYQPVGDGKGDYDNPHREYVGDGNGSIKQFEYESYSYVGKGNGRFNLKYEFVGDGKGSYETLKAIVENNITPDSGFIPPAQASGGGVTAGPGKWSGDNYENSVSESFSGEERLSEAGVAALTPGADVSDWFAPSVADGFTSFKAEIVSASIFSFKIKVTGTVDKQKCPFYISMTVPASVKANGKERKLENYLVVIDQSAGGISYPTSPSVSVNNGNYGLSFKVDSFGGADTDLETYYYVGAGKGRYELLSCDDVGEGNGAYSKRTDLYYNPVGAGKGDYEYICDYVGEGKGSYKKEEVKTYGGLSNIKITGSAGMPEAYVKLSNDKNVFECVYPICNTGKRYDFEVNIEPLNRNLRQFYKLEKLSVEADDGIGEIDFSNTAPTVSLTYDGEKPIVKFNNLNLPSNLKNARIGIDYWFTHYRALKNGDVDWDTPGALVWITQYYTEGVVTECSDDPLSNGGGFKRLVDLVPYDTLYAFCYVEFEVPESSGVTWRSPSFTALTKLR